MWALDIVPALLTAARRQLDAYSDVLAEVSTSGCSEADLERVRTRCVAEFYFDIVSALDSDH